MDFSDVLLIHIDDDESDTDLLKRILDQCGYNGKYKHFFRGEDFIDYLDEILKFGQSSLPSLVFLDIGLPGISGKDVLKKLRSNKRTESIPVVIISGSNREADYFEAIAAGTNGYIVKSYELKNFIETCRHFVYAWALASRQKFL